MLLPLCAGMCCTEEDEYNFTNYSEDIQEVSTIVNEQTTYTVGDSLIIETTINVDQEFDGEILALDEISIDEDNEGFFYYAVVFHRLSDFGAASRVNISLENIVEIDGTAISRDGFIGGSTVIEDDRFKNSYGIILREAGNYGLGGRYNEEGTAFSINYNFSADDVRVNLYSQLDPDSLSGNFEFEVVE